VSGFISTTYCGIVLFSRCFKI